MSKTRLILASVLTAFAVSAVASATASAAPQYIIEGAEFNGIETIDAALTPGTVAILKSKLNGGATIEIECKKSKLKKGTIEERFRLKTEAVVYEECKVKTPISCKVSETLTTDSVSAEAVDVGTTEVSEVFKPTTPETFIPIAVTGCAGEGNYKVTGSAECVWINPMTDVVGGLCQFTATSGSKLKFGTNEATLTQESEFFLTGANLNKKWHIRH